MVFTTGQTIRVNENAEVADFVKGRLAVIDEVVPTPKGPEYVVMLHSLRARVSEVDLSAGPREAVH